MIIDQPQSTHMKNKNSNDTYNKSKTSALSTDTRQLNVKLRSYYNSIANEPIPDHFLDLLEKLDNAEEEAKQSPQQNDHE